MIAGPLLRRVPPPLPGIEGLRQQVPRGLPQGARGLVALEGSVRQHAGRLAQRVGNGGVVVLWLAGFGDLSLRLLDDRLAELQAVLAALDLADPLAARAKCRQGRRRGASCACMTSAYGSDRL